MKKALLAAVVGITALGNAQLPDSPVVYLKGKKMPSFSMAESTGKTITNATQKGRVTILDFWATWCGPCRMMSAILEQLYGHYHSAGLDIFGADAGERRDGDIERWLISRPHGYPITLRNDAFAEKLEISSFPTVIVIDKKGIVRMVQIGIARSTPNDLDQLIKKLLSKSGKQ